MAANSETAVVPPFVPREVQHLIKISQAHLGVAETRCGTTIEIRLAAEVDGLPICPECQGRRRP